MILPIIFAALAAASCLNNGSPAFSDCSTAAASWISGSSSVGITSSISVAKSISRATLNVATPFLSVSTPIPTATSLTVSPKSIVASALNVTSPSATNVSIVINETHVNSSAPTVIKTTLSNYTSISINSTSANNVSSSDKDIASNDTLTIQISRRAAAAQKAVFAHYLVGTVYPEHAHADIDGAAAIGLDGFALNVADAGQQFVWDTLSYMFDYARDNHPNFKMFFSFDLWASKADGDHLDNYHDLFAAYKGLPAYLTGPNGFSFVSTFSAGDTQNSNWTEFFDGRFAGEVYFVPNFDGTAGYWTADPGWWAYWGDTVDGLFSWDSVWPARGLSTGAGDVSIDKTVLAGSLKHDKTYMIGLSPLQYKNSYDANYYRQGELNLPIRMENILSMSPSPNYTEIISWNGKKFMFHAAYDQATNHDFLLTSVIDGPESHYIGWLWLEQNNETQPFKYANQQQWSHLGWQPLITSFIVAFKAGKKATEMVPTGGKKAVGALWYKTMLKTSVCPETDDLDPLTSKYSQKTDGWETGSDNLNWAVVLPSDPAGMQIRIISNGITLATIPGKAGLNYGATTNMQAGPQRMELIDSAGNIVLASSGGRCVSNGCPDCIYNMNYQVVELTTDNGWAGICPYSVCKKAVFAHYMIGNALAEHIHKDIDDAVAMGLDGFSLNIGDPAQDFVRQSMNDMFDYTRDNHPNFKLFVSMDVWATKQGGNFLSGYHSILADFKGHPAYLQGPNGASFISTFSDGGFQNFEWQAWRDSWGQDLYFVPNFDGTLGYNTSDPGWWAYWGDVVDGLFSWEFAWPKRGEADDGSAILDTLVRNGAAERLKSYMMPLSALQYKNAYQTNYYRHGELNLVKKMENILAMANPPDYVQVITWNDGPESHYIGNLWLEQNNDTQPLKYANSDWSHTGWQPIITSFIKALKTGVPASKMAPPDGVPAVGALWYRTILTTSVCPNEGSNMYTKKPDGFEAALDMLNWAVVLPSTASGMRIRTITNGNAQFFNVGPGLNYGSTPVQAGVQRMELLDASGAIVLAATGGRCVSSGCPDCIYNMNYQVVGLIEDTGEVGKCPYQQCEKSVFAHYMVGNVQPEHAQQDVDDAVKAGLDGFALNVADPGANYVRQTFNSLFDYTRDQHPNFKLFLCMDLWAEGNVYGKVILDKYDTLFADFKDHGAYRKGPNDHPFVSTYSSGGLYNTDWTSWRQSWNEEVYLVPDFDDTAGYNTSDPGWWAYWGDVVDGTFSWETAWPRPGVFATGSVEVDQSITISHYDHRKSYMMPLSALQYKDSYDTNYYRDGDLLLPMRIDSILSMDPQPDFVQVLTWNDGPESHYIGNLWLEQNNDTQPLLYASQEFYPHQGWQPLITSFIGALKAGVKSTAMVPPQGQIAVGALWYKTILQSTICPQNPDESIAQYFVKPLGSEIGLDQLNWAVVLPASGADMRIRLLSNGVEIQNLVGKPGLNYGAAVNVEAGPQRMELIDATGNVILAATGGRCISNRCMDCVYNLNPQVVPLIQDTGSTGPCPTPNCDAIPGPVPEPDSSDGWTSSGFSTAAWASENGQKCFMGPCNSDCGIGYVEVNRALSCDKPICCPPDAIPTCQWRGGETGPACHGQCHANEVTLFYDRNGDGSACYVPGLKAFCCITQTFTDLINSCVISDCVKVTEQCDPGYNLVEHKSDYSCPFGTLKKICCPQAANINNCHWVGKGTCDDNMCDDNDITLLLDDQGGVDSAICVGGGRKKSLCCDAPTTSNPFLPVPLEYLFPTPPPDTDMPKWDVQLLGIIESATGAVSADGGPDKNGFGFVVIDGPLGAVVSLSKRDGSHYHFLDCPKGEERQRLRLFCTGEVYETNCRDIYIDGVEGTIIKMPAGCGDGTYAVVHDIYISPNQSLPAGTDFTLPDGNKIMELDMSYDFGLVERVKKRGASDVFIRVDYSNIPEYWSHVVDVAGEYRKKKRSGSGRIDKRFFSPDPAAWGDKFHFLTSGDTSERTPFAGTMNMPIYGKVVDCTGTNNFAEIGLTGTASGNSRWGFSFVGKISPFKLEQAYGFFDNDIELDANLNIQIYGHLDVHSVQGNAFDAPISFKGFSEPGLLNFKPSLQVGVILSAEIELDADMSLTLSTYTQRSILQTYPGSAGVPGGSTGGSYTNVLGDVLEAYPLLGETTGTFHLSIVPTMNMDLAFARYGGGSGSYEAIHETASSYIEAFVDIKSADSCANVAIGISRPYISLFSSADEFDLWSGDDDTTNSIPGTIPSTATLPMGCASPYFNVAKRDTPSDIVQYLAPFVLQQFELLGDCATDLDYDGDIYAPLTCTNDLFSYDPSLAFAGDPPNSKLKRKVSSFSKKAADHLSSLSVRGISSGSAGAYVVYNEANKVQEFFWLTPTYPSGNNGADLDEASDDADGTQYGLHDESTCFDPLIIRNAPRVGKNAVTVVTEHIVERQSVVSFGQFVQIVKFDLMDNRGDVTYNLPAVDFSILRDWLNKPYKEWPAGYFDSLDVIPPSSGTFDFSEALGSSNNPSVLVNFDAVLNNMKARMWAADGNPTADKVFDSLITPTKTNAKEALSLLRGGLAVFNYLNDPGVHSRIIEIYNDVCGAMNTFDVFYNRKHVAQTRMQDLFRLWFNLQLSRIENRHKTYQNARLSQLQASWQNRLDNLPPSTFPVNRPVESARRECREILGQIAQLKYLVPGTCVISRAGLPATVAGMV